LKKILIIFLIAIPVIFWGIWLAFPKTSIQSIIENSIHNDKLTAEIKGLRKDFWYGLSIDGITLKSSGEEQISFNNISARINPLALMLLQLKVSFDGDIGGGDISGHMNRTSNMMQIELAFKRASINVIPLFKHVGVQGIGTISGKFNMINGTGHAEFATKDASFEPAVFSGVTVPLNFFHSIKGAIDIRGNIVDVVSIALEGKDIYARLKGVIRDAFIDLNMELMPGISFIENPLFINALEKYKVSPGYYVVPVKRDYSSLFPPTIAEFTTSEFDDVVIKIYKYS
jgi:type II secretion system protein N